MNNIVTSPGNEDWTIGRCTPPMQGKDLQAEKVKWTALAVLSFVVCPLTAIGGAALIGIGCAVLGPLCLLAAPVCAAIATCGLFGGIHCFDQLAKVDEAFKHAKQKEALQNLSLSDTAKQFKLRTIVEQDLLADRIPEDTEKQQFYQRLTDMMTIGSTAETDLKEARKFIYYKYQVQSARLAHEEITSNLGQASPQTFSAQGHEGVPIAPQLKGDLNKELVEAENKFKTQIEALNAEFAAMTRSQ